MAVLTAFALGGCGSSDDAEVANRPAEPRVHELHWIEASAEADLTFRVEQLVIRRAGWELTASVTNGASSAYVNQRPHRPGGSMFGLVLLETATRQELRELTADFRKAPPFLEPDRIEPRLPRVLPPGSRWRGRLTGSMTLREGSVVRALFGRFARVRGQPQYVIWVTEHSVRL